MNKAILNKYFRKFGFEVHGTGYIQAVKKSSFKEDPFERQRHLIKKEAPIIFDVGANRGDVVAKYQRYFPSAKYYCFEPFPASFEILEQHYKDNSNVKLFNVALSDKPEEKQFYVNKNVDTNSLLKPQKTGLSSDAQVKNQGIIKVNATTIDMVCEQEGINHIDILKMDIQGGELAALKGATQLLSQRRIDCIYSEVYFVQQYEGQPLFHDTSKFLFDYGFELQDIYSPIYGNGNLAWGDAIFILKR